MQKAHTASNKRLLGTDFRQNTCVCTRFPFSSRRLSKGVFIIRNLPEQL